MIRYRLKDRELQAAYEKCLKDFDHHLQIACEGFDDEEETVVLHHLCKTTDKPLIAWELTISKKEIEPVEEYDPLAWNNYPEVTPPEKVWMQCEGHFTTGGKYKGGAVYDGEHWYVPILGTLARFNIVIERFRPWDEEVTK